MTQPMCFKTRFFVPGWWARAFDASVVHAARETSAIELSAETQLSPALTPTELTALSVLLASLQTQLIAGDQTLTLDPIRHRKYVSSPSRSQMYSFERALQGISGLRLLAPDGRDGFSSIPIFRSEAWRRRDRRRGLLLELELSPLGDELILGYGEPYLNLVRLNAGQASSSSLLGSRPPLALWRSTWLDLQGVEQALLLRLEQAMQWEFRWLQLDGIFGQGLKELFHDLELPRARRKDGAASPMESRLRVLSRFGKKLVDHGLLVPNIADQYLAMSSSERSGMTLVWQARPDHILGDESREYLRLVCSYLQDGPYTRQFAAITRLLAGELFDDALGRQLSDGWQAIQNEERQMPLDPVTVIGGNLPLTAAKLFIEWMIRQLPGHPCPLVGWLKESPLAELAAPTSRGDFVARYASFRKMLDEEPDYAAALDGTVGATLVSATTQADAKYRAFILAPPKPSAASAVRGAERKPATRVEEPSPRVGAKAAPRPQPPEPVSEGHLKRIAAEELLKLRQQDPKGYAVLKRKFLDSLDANKRKIFLEVSERVEPRVFDDHLRHPLVNYMVENPGVWRSVGSEQRT